MADLGVSKTDTGSASTQVGLLTARINELTDHMKINKRFCSPTRSTPNGWTAQKLLKYIADRDSAKYLSLIKKLGLRR